MKRTLIAAAGFALFAATGLANAAFWSVVVQPGVYGRVEIGGYAEAPQVYSNQPVIAVDNGDGYVVEEYVDPAYATAQPPVYLWVPDQQPQWPVRGNVYGAPLQVPIQYIAASRDDNRDADQRQTRGQTDGRGQFEPGREANRDR